MTILTFYLIISTYVIFLTLYLISMTWYLLISTFNYLIMTCMSILLLTKALFSYVLEQFTLLYWNTIFFDQRTKSQESFVCELDYTGCAGGFLHAASKENATEKQSFSIFLYLIITFNSDCKFAKHIFAVTFVYSTMLEKHHKSGVKGKLVQFSVVYTDTYTLQQ